MTARKQAQEELREKEEQYRAIFESTSDGLFINTLEGQLVDFNPAAARMHGYTVEEFHMLQPSDFIHPDSLPLFRDYIEAVRAGQTFRGRAVDRRKDGSYFHVEVIGQGFSYGGKPHTLAIVRDVTEEVEAYQLLEQRVEERTRELSTLLEVSQNVASTLELNPLLTLLLDQLGGIVDYHGAAVSIVDGEELVFLAYRGPLPQEQVVGTRRPLRRSELVWQRLEAHDYILVGDMHSDTPLARAFQGHFDEVMSASLEEDATCLLVPLIVRERVIGSLILSHGEREYYSDHDASLVMAVAQQAAAAIENARLYQAAQEEARKTAALAQVASHVALGGPLELALNEVARNVVEASGAEACSLILTAGTPPRPQVLGAYGLPEGYTASLDALIRSGDAFLNSPALYLKPGPLVVRDARQSFLAEQRWASLHPFVAEVTCDTMISLPSVYHGRHLGRLNLYYPAGQEPGEVETTFLTAIANQAALAIENARLFAAAQDKAARKNASG
ncbi:MAG TPA: PAS domain S-box protein [Ardenticatenaceae bacterium]|nr:PAS domain S-box protein [Ardenticatenaceae bacterium]